MYVSCPQNDLPKEYKRLCGFGKTKELAPQESETLTIVIPASALTSFHETSVSWVLEKGTYGIWVGNSCQAVSLDGVLTVENDVVMETVSHICSLQEELKELVCEKSKALEEAWIKEAEALTPIVFAPKAADKKKVEKNTYDAMAEELAEKLTNGEDIDLNRVFVTHAGCDPQLVESIAELVKNTLPFKEVLVTRAGCTVSSHCGANTLGVLFIRKTPLN